MPRAEANMPKTMEVTTSGERTELAISLHALCRSVIWSEIPRRSGLLKYFLQDALWNVRRYTDAKIIDLHGARMLTFRLRGC